MNSRVFIDRPVFAWVIALGILLSGIIAMRGLPIEQYPSVAPPSLSINVTYPGADAATLEQNVTQLIEQELNGIEGFLYMSSSSQSNGTASINLTFAAGTALIVPRWTSRTGCAGSSNGFPKMFAGKAFRSMKPIRASFRLSP